MSFSLVGRCSKKSSRLLIILLGVDRIYAEAGYFVALDAAANNGHIELVNRLLAIDIDEVLETPTWLGASSAAEKVI